MLRGAVQFHRRVRRSVFGRLVLLMVVGWLVSMYSLGITATAYMMRDPSTGVPIVLPIFLVWGVTMGGITYAVWKWSREAVILNALYTDLEILVEQRTHALAESLERERQLEQARTQLLSLVAHDMVTPLATIGMELHLLKQAPEGPGLDPAKAVERIERNLAYVRKLVSDVRDLGKIRGGRLNLSLAELDLSVLVAAVASSFEARAADKGIRMDVRVEGPIRVRADSQRLTQVLFNLLSNALKFTPRKGDILLEALPQGDEVLVRVRDTGRGLEADALDRLFQPFAPGEHPTSGAEKGTGLGLYICKGIVEQHGDRIWGSSEGPGTGATFAFSLPRLAVASVPAPIEVRPALA